MESHLAEMKKWYDGYHFGDTDVYCPWDVLNHVDCLCDDPQAHPQSYWINTSGNDLVKRFINKADKKTKDEIERLVAGEIIEKPVRLDLTYDEIDHRIDNLWSVLFTTGYLTQDGMSENGVYKLKIPNEEVKEVYMYQIQEWFKNVVLGDTEQLTAFWKAFESGNAGYVEQYLVRVLNQTISVFDTKGQALEKENVYHTFLLGLLSGNANWLVKSNIESGDGFADIIIETEQPDSGMIIELKYSKSFSGLEKSCKDAIAQVRNRRYDTYLKNDGRQNILVYGIAFCKKKCKVMIEV